MALPFLEAKRDTPRGKHNLWAYEPLAKKQFHWKLCKGAYVMEITTHILSSGRQTNEFVH